VQDVKLVALIRATGMELFQTIEITIFKQLLQACSIRLPRHRVNFVKTKAA